MSIAMPPALLSAILAEAAATPERETCGLLTGAPDRIEGTIPTANVADDPGIAFEINPAALFAALRRERAGGPRLIGCYHSHPNGSAMPSAADAAAAQPGTLWLIVGNGGARLWRAGTEGFAEVPLCPDRDGAEKRGE